MIVHITIISFNLLEVVLHLLLKTIPHTLPWLLLVDISSQSSRSYVEPSPLPPCCQLDQHYCCKCFWLFGTTVARSCNSMTDIWPKYIWTVSQNLAKASSNTYGSQRRIGVRVILGQYEHDWSMQMLKRTPCWRIEDLLGTFSNLSTHCPSAAQAC